MRLPRLAAAVLAAALLTFAPAFAQFRNVGPGVADRTTTVARGGDEDWVFGGEAQTAIELDVNGRRGPVRQNGNLFTESLLSTYLLMPHGFVLNGVFRLEQSDSALDGRGSVFRGQTLWADELNLTWSTRSLDLFGGKFHPRFGSAWDRGPGLYGTDFGREYELVEKLGVGARIWLSDFFDLYKTIGTHNFQAEFFEADRTALSWGAFNGRWAQQRTSVDPETGETVTRTVYRWQNRRGTGTPDNTDFLGGTVLSLAGFGIPMPRGQAGYTLSYSARRPGSDAVESGRSRTEQGFTAGGFWTVPLPARVIGAPFVEYARLDNAGGYRRSTQDWLTAGFDLRRTPWTISYAYLQNGNEDRAEGTRGTRVQHTASVTYDLYFLVPLPILRPLSATIGWRRLREAGVASNDVGGLIGWSWKF